MGHTNFSFFQRSPLRKVRLLAGLDEAGRGPLAGPVVAAVVILPIKSLKKMGLEKLNDSKKLTAQQREALIMPIKQHAVAWAVAWADSHEVDSINILNASLLAMRRCLLSLPISPQRIIVDGNKVPDLPCELACCGIEALIKGDALVPAISAASVLAKVARDEQLQRLHEKYPEYNFKQHKGYPTPAHLAMLKKRGPCRVHRYSFTPVKNSVQ